MLINSLNFWVIGFIRRISRLRRTIPIAVQDIAVLAGGTALCCRQLLTGTTLCPPFQRAGAELLLADQPPASRGIPDNVLNVPTSSIRMQAVLWTGQAEWGQGGCVRCK